MTRKMLRFTLCLILLLCLSGVAPAQRAGQGAFAPVPKALRGRLSERLKLYLEYERGKRFDRMYEMFSDAHIAFLKSLSITSKEDYVQRNKSQGHWRLDVITFIPTRTSKKAESGEAYVIRGWIESRWGKTVRKDPGTIEARLQDGQWYFAELGMEVPE